MKEKKVKKILLSFLLVILMATGAWGAATCTATKTVISESGITWYVLGTWTWVSHTDGTVSGVGSLANVSGCITQFVNIPSATATQPSNAFDMVLTITGGPDALMGSGANLSNDPTSTAQYKTIRNLDGGPVCVHNATLTPSITNAGSGKAGVFYLILR